MMLIQEETKELENLIKWLNENCYMTGGKLHTFNDKVFDPKEIVEKYNKTKN